MGDSTLGEEIDVLSSFEGGGAVAVGVVLEFDGVTVEQYDRVMEMLGAAAGGPMPAGGLFGWVIATENGIRVAEVWESVEAFRQFSAERFGPKAGEVGITVAPRISFRDIHC
ncbi:hypothetical protein ACWCW7_07480 [Nocardia tengchongensis]